MTSFSDFLMQLNQDYQSDKIGTVYQCPERKITRKIKDPHTLILIVGVEGAGKTTFCKNNFSGFNVINFDSFIADNIKSVKDEEFDSLWNKFLNHAKECLQKGTTVIDANSVMMNFRFKLLYLLDGCYSKAVLVVLNPTKTQLISRIKSQLSLRIRPGMWEDVGYAYDSLQEQLQNNMISVGVSEVYIIK